MTGRNPAHPVLGVVAKTRQPTTRELTSQILEWCRARKLDYRVDSEIATELNFTESEKIIDRREIARQCGLIVVLGGDGTLISVCRHGVSPPPTILGVNAGTLGFLTEITTDELFPVLEETLAGRAKLETRSLLAAEVWRKGKRIAEYSAMNDVVLSKEALARMFSVEVSVSGEFAAIIRGDGVIVATPGGSTAYSLAAGGSIVHPQVNAILITPTCPHSLSTRPLVVPGNSTIDLVLVSKTNRAQKEIYLTIDGQEGMELRAEDRVTVTTSQHRVVFVKSPSRTYYDVLGTKLKWATR